MSVLSKISDLKNDNTSGSSGVLTKLIIILKEYYKDKNTPRNKDNKEIIKNLKELNSHFVDFLVLKHFINYFTKDIYSQSPLKLIDNYINKWKNVNKQIAENLLSSFNLQNKTLLLHSNSSTVKEVLKNIYEISRINYIIQTISRPACEGIKQAEYLEKIGYKVKLIEESAISLFIKDIDYVLFGADSIYKNCFVNKTGSYLINLLAKEFDKKVLVLSDSRKISNKKLNNFRKVKKEPSEIYNGNSRIEVANYYFETIPLENEILIFND